LIDWAEKRDCQKKKIISMGRNIDHTDDVRRCQGLKKEKRIC